MHYFKYILTNIKQRKNQDKNIPYKFYLISLCLILISILISFIFYYYIIGNIEYCLVQLVQPNPVDPGIKKIVHNIANVKEEKIIIDNIMGQIVYYVSNNTVNDPSLLDNFYPKAKLQDNYNDILAEWLMNYLSINPHVKKEFINLFGNDENIRKSLSYIFHAVPIMDVHNINNYRGHYFVPMSPLLVYHFETIDTFYQIYSSFLVDLVSSRYPEEDISKIFGIPKTEFSAYLSRILYSSMRYNAIYPITDMDGRRCWAFVFHINNNSNLYRILPVCKYTNNELCPVLFNTELLNNLLTLITSLYVPTTDEELLIFNSLSIEQINLVWKTVIKIQYIRYGITLEAIVVSTIWMLGWVAMFIGLFWFI